MDIDHDRGMTSGVLCQPLAIAMPLAGAFRTVASDMAQLMVRLGQLVIRGLQRGDLLLQLTHFTFERSPVRAIAAQSNATDALLLMPSPMAAATEGAAVSWIKRKVRMRGLREQMMGMQTVGSATFETLPVAGAYGLRPYGESGLGGHVHFGGWKP